PARSPAPRSFPTRRSSDLVGMVLGMVIYLAGRRYLPPEPARLALPVAAVRDARASHRRVWWLLLGVGIAATIFRGAYEQIGNTLDRKSTRLNSSHVKISYA